MTTGVEQASPYPLANQEIGDLANRFTHHTPNTDQPSRYQLIRSHIHLSAIAMMRECPRSRELSLALTKLEEAVFWANAAIARNEPTNPTEQEQL